MLFALAGNDNQSPPSVKMVGEKGYGLYWLGKHGFPIPTTWVLQTSAFDLVVEQAGLRGLIARVEQALAGLSGDWLAAQRTLESLEPDRAMLVEGLRLASMPDQVGMALEKLVFMQTLWAVRPSATIEDHSAFSFARQFESLLSSSGGLALWRAVRQVWASTFGRNALTYCAQKAIDLPRMAVVLQPMAPIVPQDRSGVAYSHSPAPTLPGVFIQVAFGAGQDSASGQGGDLYSVHEGRVQIQPMRSTVIRVTGADGEMELKPPPSGFALNAREARELADLVLAVADQWGGPVNVEFVWRAGHDLTLLQVRSAADQQAVEKSV